LLVLEMTGTAASFFTATYPYCSTIAAATGLCVFVVWIRRLLRGIAGGQVISFIALAALVIPAAARGRLGYDIGLYHLQAIKWLTSGATPLGLANLYGRLGFNDGWAPVAAMMETPALLGKSVFFVNVVFVLLVGLYIIDAVSSLLRHGFDRARALLACGIYPLALLSFKDDGLSYNPDLVVVLLVLIVSSMWLEADDDGSERGHAGLLSMFALTVKLSALPLLVGTAGIMIFRWSVRRMGVVSAIGVTAALLWMARGVALSGCLLYPSTIGRLGQLQWAVPEAKVRYEAEAVRAWAEYHLPSQPVANGYSITPQVWKMLRTERVVAAGGLFALGLILWGMGRVRGNDEPVDPSRSWWAPAIVAIGGIGFWLWTAPSLRFGYGYVFCVAATMFCAGLETWPIVLPRRWRVVTILGIVLALLASCEYYRRLNHATLIRWPAVPTARLRTQKTAEGVTFYLPTPPDDRVWDAPLPATAYPDPALRCQVSAKGQFERFWLDPSRAPLLAP
jgi:hypothetical protein